MEPVIDEQLLGWIRRVDQKWVSRCGTFKPFDIGKRIQFLTVDIITKICLGKALGCVDSDNDKHNFLETVQQGNFICQHLSVLLELNSLLYYLTKMPYLGKLIVPKAADHSGVGRIMGVSTACLHVYVWAQMEFRLFAELLNNDWLLDRRKQMTC